MVFFSLAVGIFVYCCISKESLGARALRHSSQGDRLGSGRVYSTHTKSSYDENAKEFHECLPLDIDRRLGLFDPDPPRFAAAVHCKVITV